MLGPPQRDERVNDRQAVNHDARREEAPGHEEARGFDAARDDRVATAGREADPRDPVPVPPFDDDELPAGHPPDPARHDGLGPAVEAREVELALADLRRLADERERRDVAVGEAPGWRSPGRRGSSSSEGRCARGERFDVRRLLAELVPDEEVEQRRDEAANHSALLGTRSTHEAESHGTLKTLSFDVRRTAERNGSRWTHARMRPPSTS